MAPKKEGIKNYGVSIKIEKWEIDIIKEYSIFTMLKHRKGNPTPISKY